VGSWLKEIHEILCHYESKRNDERTINKLLDNKARNNIQFYTSQFKPHQQLVSLTTINLSILLGNCHYPILQCHSNFSVLFHRKSMTGRQVHLVYVIVVDWEIRFELMPERRDGLCRIRGRTRRRIIFRCESGGGGRCTSYARAMCAVAMTGRK